VVIISYVPKGSGFLPDKEVDELKELYRHENDGKGCIRLLCAIHRKKGRSVTEIAEMLELPVSTVSDHLRRVSGDFGNLHDKHTQQRPPKLTQKEYHQLITAIRNSPVKSGYPAVVWITQMVRHYIDDRFGKKFTVHGVRKLLYRAGFTRLKPRPYHMKGNKKEQENFKKNYPPSLVNICKMDMRSFFWINQDSS
jgi:transposase